MSFSNSSPTFRYNFTDGSFITVINIGSDRPMYGNGEYTLTIPNCYIGDFDTYSGEMTKYDLAGNVFVFSNRGVKINGVDYTRQASRFYFTYNPEDKIFNIVTARPIPEMFPRFLEGQYYVSALFYDEDTSHTQYDSIGEVIAKGEEYVADHGGWYTVANILPRNEGSVFHGSTSFAVRNFSYESNFESFLNNAASNYTPVDLNIDDSIEDFDPEVPIDPTEDPYDPDGDGTEPGGGEGNHDDGSDDIDIPSLPTLSAVDTGFITLYRPSAGDLVNLANYLWSSPLAIWDNLKKIVQQPMDCILGLSIVPVNPSVGASKAITIADVNTGVNTYPVTSQYVEVDCGSITISEYWGAYLDYEPYTKAEVYLPYIGTHPISIDDIMGKTITIKYHVDVLSGACTAYVKCGRSVLYSFIGQCASSIPIGGNDWTNVITGALTIATAIGSMVASGGASAPMSGSATPEQIAHAESMHRAAMIREVGEVASTAVNVLKPSIGKSGSMSGTGGLMAIQKPYLILTRPRQAVPGSQNHYMGYPSFITASIGSLSGYTEVEEVHLDGIPGTDNELAEIESLLRGGVYL